MVTGVALACAVVLACALILLAFRRLRIRSDRRLEAVLMEIDEHLGAISTSVAQAIDRVAEARGEGPQLFLTLDLEELVDHSGRGGGVTDGRGRRSPSHRRPRRATRRRRVGPERRRRAARAGIRPTRRQTVSIRDDPDWTYDRSDEQEGAPFHSALVAPLEPTAGGPGAALAVYSTAPGAFNPAHATALSALVDEAATGLTNARRFAEVEARSLLDPATGVPNPRGYELELGREVARAHRSGRPLSVVLVGIDGASRGAERGGNGVADVARLLTRVTRKSDISCRRGEREFAILLPGTREKPARRRSRIVSEKPLKRLQHQSSTLTGARHQSGTLTRRSRHSTRGPTPPSGAGAPSQLSLHGGPSGSRRRSPRPSSGAMPSKRSPARWTPHIASNARWRSSCSTSTASARSQNDSGAKRPTPCSTRSRIGSTRAWARARRTASNGPRVRARARRIHRARRGSTHRSGAGLARPAPRRGAVDVVRRHHGAGAR